MASFHLAPSLQALGDEVTREWSPKWPTLALGDGWVGDTSHQARKSDHNPDWDAGGVVRAVDIGIEGRDAQRILNAAIGDPRVWYVIHKARIYSRTYGWVSRAYTGSNPHNHHIHISVNHDRASETDTSPWLSKGAPAPAQSEEDDLMANLDEPLNQHDPKGLLETRGITVREALMIAVVHAVSGRRAAKRVWQNAQKES